MIKKNIAAIIGFNQIALSSAYIARNAEKVLIL
jgi:uncharacterized membrane protein YtjA (UPF0391 family)